MTIKKKYKVKFGTQVEIGFFPTKIHKLDNTLRRLLQNVT